MAIPISVLTNTLPNCAVPCATQALEFTKCAVANYTSSCLCTDSGYRETYRLCVRASCDMLHILSAKNATWTWCDFHYQNQMGSSLGRVAVVVITGVLFFLRLIAKFMRLSTWGADDAALIIGYLVSLSFAVSRFYGHNLGIGKDVWSLSHDEINRFMQVFFAFEILYTLSIGALKAAILFFYLRVFSMVNNIFTAVLWSTQAFNIVNCLAFTIANLNQCKPFSFSWEGWDGRHPGRCINLVAMLISHAAVNIALDVWMLALPVTQVLWLNMRKRQKFEILAMFGLGIFITVVSAIRMRVLLNFRNFSDPTYDVFYLHLWSYLELSVAVIVACLPSTRQLWRELMPKLKKKLGFGVPSRPSRPGESAKRLKDILFLSGDAPSPTSAGGFMSPSSSTRTRSGVLEDDVARK